VCSPRSPPCGPQACTPYLARAPLTRPRQGRSCHGFRRPIVPLA